jgi:hypothetical protein
MNYYNLVTKYLVSLVMKTDDKVLSCAHDHKPLTMLSFTPGNISSAFCSTSLGTLAAR